MLNRVAFTLYPVVDMERARAFYEDALSLVVSSTSGKGQWVEYDLPGGGCFALTTFTQAKPSKEAGGMIAFEVEDLDALVARLESQGVEFASDLIESPVCRMRVCQDSEGNALLLHQLKRAS